MLMSEKMKKALMSAAASSAMEGMALDGEMLRAAEQILEGKMTLQDYFDRIGSDVTEK